MAQTINLSYGDLRASIQREKSRRIREYQANIAKIKSMRESGLFDTAPEPLRLIAQGDSWFDYPLPVPKIDQSDVVSHLQHLPSKTPHVLPLAMYGESTEDMLGVVKLHELIQNLNNPTNGGFDAILFSGGGNDLAGNQFRLWLRDAPANATNPADALDQVRVDAILGVIRAGYEDLFIARDKSAYPEIPIFGHSYDFAIPNGVPVNCVVQVGPWLKPGLDDRGWKELKTTRKIVRLLLEQLANMLDGFEADKKKKFVHVRTQGTLTAKQWANELHPKPEGFAAITAKFVAALRNYHKFRDRI
ncbi:MAG: SGNH/GDSL hydrolase family protein [Candidatus Pacebacteria bacterium]|nr:SGNH/GDSL hydrolase family protein [Candidatus Paceibacterota bacterium]